MNHEVSVNPLSQAVLAASLFIVEVFVSYILASTRFTLFADAYQMNNNSLVIHILYFKVITSVARNENGYVEVPRLDNLTNSRKEISIRNFRFPPYLRRNIANIDRFLFQ